MPPMNVDAALARNRAFAAAGGQEDAPVFPRLRLMVVTCLDPRVDPAHFLGLGLGDAMVIRNGGGRITHEVLEEIAFVAELAGSLAPDIPLFEVAVVHHTQCAIAEGTPRERAAGDPFVTVTRDVERLRSARSVSAALLVSGHVYDVETGTVKTVVPADGETGDGEVTAPKGRR